MEILNITLGFTNILMGGLLLGLSIPLVKGKVKMNYFYGVRFKKSFESEENWYALNRYGGRLLTYWSVLIMAVGVACLFIRFEAGSVFFWIATLAPLAVLIPAYQTYRYGQRL